jgi:hypothetical protein
LRKNLLDFRTDLAPPAAMWGAADPFQTGGDRFPAFLFSSTLPSSTEPLTPSVWLVGQSHSLFLSRKSTPIAAVPTFSRMLRFQIKRLLSSRNNLQKESKDSTHELLVWDT